MLKIFSNDNLTRKLNSKFGKNFYENLTNKKFTLKELEQIKSEILNFSENENFKKENFDIDHIKDCLRNISPKKYDFSNEVLQKKKPFGVFAKKSNSFFDTAIQYGGESDVMKISSYGSGSNFYNRKGSKSPIKKGNGNFFNANNYINSPTNYVDYNSNSKININNDYDYDNVYGNTFSKKTTKFNEEFFINNEISNELLKKPMKII